ncbi:MAG: isochorismatase family protein [Catenulispora sp.]
MELIPARTAIIAVPMQHDVVSAAGAFGGLFAAQAAERDVAGRIGRLSDAARRAGAAAVPVAGVATNASVQSTAPQATDLGYRTILVVAALETAAAGA